jgi:hypothetical protein
VEPASAFGVWILLWRGFSPPSPARQCPGDAKGVTGLLFPERRRGGASALVAVPPFFGLASEAYCVPRELVMRMFERDYRQAITKVRASGQIGESQYVIFEDGAVVIETPKRVRRFNNLQELMSQARSSSARPSLRSV